MVIVAVYRLGIANSYAACSCGWAAPRRWLTAAACQDAWLHAAEAGCELHRPLVAQFSSR